ncbi:hypothetical protein DOM21_17410 [Bacteriovorax stolpii]|uniref:hypothetical protein n=1 Tax=Bacteriovorax stolpii TaxID=960 RepID=UPI0011589C7F|nr:hypothetical protein [Bacteriovorax stolpii]QDK43201.1 hypothetical protein DOM21_17410 [Bacteriovorax stolpii]
MGKHKGASKTGGRKKGTPNRRSLEFRNLLLGEGIDIVKEFATLYKKQTDDEIKLKMLLSSLDFSFPKLKSIDDSSDEHEDENSEEVGIDLEKMSDEDLDNLIAIYSKYSPKEVSRSWDVFREVTSH